jgi:imidazolonepropionase-like amidohydrolase
MKHTLLMFALVVCVDFAAAQTLLISNVTLIDATGKPPQPGQNVLVRAGKIAAIGARIKAPNDARRIDGGGKFLIPGLWDMHTHVAGISADPKWGKHLLSLYLAHGIVGIRDMAGDLETLLTWKRAQATGMLAGPKMIVSGPFLDGSAKGFPLPTDVIEVTSPAASAEQVRGLKQRGADFIKIGSQLKPEVFAAIASECKSQGMTFAGHVPDSVRVEDATRAGMKSMEHMFGMLWAVSGKAGELEKRAAQAQASKDREALAQINAELEASYSAEKAAQLAALFKQHGTWLVPTLAWTETATLMDKIEASPMLSMFPAKLQSEWSPEKAHSIFSPRGIAFYTRKLKNDIRLVKVMADAGVPILAGSDSLDPYVFPGESLWRELELLYRAGLTPMQALQSATRNAALFFGNGAKAGTIEPGKVADMVLLDKDPLANLSERPQISAVIQNGKYYSRADLQSMVAEAANAMNAQP